MYYIKVDVKYLYFIQMSFLLAKKETNTSLHFAKDK